MKRASRFESLGFRYELQVGWLDYALRLTLSEKDPKEARLEMIKFLSAEKTVKGNLGQAQIRKCLSLLSSWFAPDKELVLFRDQLCKVATGFSAAQWPILHWAILAAHYPFLYQVSLVLGRLFLLQGQANKSQLERRLFETYGAMPVIERNMRYAIETLANLGFMQRQGKSGLYLPPEKLIPTDFELTAILWKALLHATKGGCVSTTTLRNSPAFYPFALSPIYLGQFVENFEDVDYRPFSGGDEQIYLREIL